MLYLWGFYLYSFVELVNLFWLGYLIGRLWVRRGRGKTRKSIKGVQIHVLILGSHCEITASEVKERIFDFDNTVIEKKRRRLVLFLSSCCYFRWLGNEKRGLGGTGKGCVKYPPPCGEARALNFSLCKNTKTTNERARNLAGGKAAGQDAPQKIKVN